VNTLKNSPQSVIVCEFELDGAVAAMRRRGPVEIVPLDGCLLPRWFRLIPRRNFPRRGDGEEQKVKK
jgi:hypothetical protein